MSEMVNMAKKKKSKMKAADNEVEDAAEKAPSRKIKDPDFLATEWAIQRGMDRHLMLYHNREGKISESRFIEICEKMRIKL